jgi:hypothetical protein
MRYLSPASLLDSPLPNPPDQKWLLLQRKKLLTNMELGTDGTLTIKNRSHSKNDILDYFETLQNDTILHYHQVIGNDKVLVDFLEDGQLPNEASFARSSLYDDVLFIHWISPYFYSSFTEYCKTCLENCDEDGLRTMFRNPLLLTEYDKERAWIQIGQILEKNIELMRRYYEKATQKKTAPKVADTSLLINDHLTQTILQLPQTPFSRLRDEYAFSAMQLSIQLFNKRYWKRNLAESWIENAKILTASQPMHNQVVYKIAEFRRIREKRGAPAPINVRVAVVVAIFLIRLIAAGGTCSLSHASTRVYTLNDHKDTTTVCATYPPPGSSTANSLQPSIAKP